MSKNRFLQRSIYGAIREYDLLRILFCWLVELTGFSGYSFQDAWGLAEWVLSEMESAFHGRTKLLKQTGKMGSLYMPVFSS